LIQSCRQALDRYQKSQARAKERDLVRGLNRLNLTGEAKNLQAALAKSKEAAGHLSQALEEVPPDTLMSRSQAEKLTGALKTLNQAVKECNEVLGEAISRVKVKVGRAKRGH
jgi:hypothetical protein